MSAENYIDELLRERSILDPSNFQHTIRILESEIACLKSNNEPIYRDLPIHGAAHSTQRPSKYKEEIIKLTEKIMVPVKEHPKFNFVGKLLGPKGNTLKRLQASTQTKISILGRGSTRDKEKEEELSQSDDPKYAHFKELLHVIIEVEAPKSDAHQRLGAALAEIQKYLVPENDEIRQEQMREMAMLNDHAPSKLIGGGNPSIIKVALPPPGTIVLSEPPISGRRVADPYIYDKYVGTFNATYEGYPETSAAELAVGSSRKRAAPLNGYPTKKFGYIDY